MRVKTEFNKHNCPVHITAEKVPLMIFRLGLDVGCVTLSCVCSP